MNVKKIDNKHLVVTSVGKHLFIAVLVLQLMFGAMIFIFDEAKIKGVFGCCSIAVIFLLLFISYRRKFEFDSKAKEMTLSTGGIFLRKKMTVPFSQITGLRMEKNTFNDKQSCRFILCLTDGEIPISNSTHKFIPGMKQDAEQILRFIKCEKPLIEDQLQLRVPDTSTQTVKFDTENIDPQIIDLVRKKRLIEAVKLVRTQTGLGLKESKDIVDLIQRSQKNNKLF